MPRRFPLWSDGRLNSSTFTPAWISGGRDGARVSPLCPSHFRLPAPQPCRQKISTPRSSGEDAASWDPAAHQSERFCGTALKKWTQRNKTTKSPAVSLVVSVTHSLQPLTGKMRQPKKKALCQFSPQRLSLLHQKEQSTPVWGTDHVRSAVTSLWLFPLVLWFDTTPIITPWRSKLAGFPEAAWHFDLKLLMAATLALTACVIMAFTEPAHVDNLSLMQLG